MLSHEHVIARTCYRTLGSVLVSWYCDKSSVFRVSKLYIYCIFIKQTVDAVEQQADFWTAATARTVSRSPWTALRPGVVQHGEFHSAEHAGGETVSMAITSVLSRRSAWRVSLRILHWLKTKNIRITVNLLGVCVLHHGTATCGYTL